MKKMKLSLMRNKKGDTSIALLVVMAIAVCIIGLYTFAFYANTGLNRIAGSGAVNELVYQQAFVENYISGIADKTAKDLKITFANSDLEGYTAEFDINLKEASEEYFSLFKISIDKKSIEAKMTGSGSNPVLEIIIKDFVLTKTFQEEVSGINSASIKKDLVLRVPLG